MLAAIGTILIASTGPTTFSPYISVASAFTAPKNSRRTGRYCKSLKMTGNKNESNGPLDEITILGFGSLLSPRSARLTFPTLRNFRLGRVPNHRRVFGHPASIFFQRGIANLDTLEMSSLSCEYEEGESFVCSVFEVPNQGLSSSGGGDDTKAGWIPSRAFLEREEEFEISMVPYEELSSFGEAVDCMGDATTSGSSSSTRKRGVICCRSTDEAYIDLWGEAHFQKQYTKHGVKTIWNWTRDSGLRPCPAYLRHCVLASWGADGEEHPWSSDGAGGRCYNSFLDDTYLVDRKTTIREYLKQHPSVMTTEPPEYLKERYGG